VFLFPLPLVLPTMHELHEFSVLNLRGRAGFFIYKKGKTVVGLSQ
jgi:hypothetical protein